jgi:hypothetical protein
MHCVFVSPNTNEVRFKRAQAPGGKSQKSIYTYYCTWFWRTFSLRVLNLAISGGAGAPNPYVDRAPHNTVHTIYSAEYIYIWINGTTVQYDHFSTTVRRTWHVNFSMGSRGVLSLNTSITVAFSQNKLLIYCTVGRSTGNADRGYCRGSLTVCTVVSDTSRPS